MSAADPTPDLSAPNPPPTEAPAVPKAVSKVVADGGIPAIGKAGSDVVVSRAAEGLVVENGGVGEG